MALRESLFALQNAIVTSSPKSSVSKILKAGGPSPAARLGIYQEAYRHRIMDALAEDFPRARKAWGKQRFDVATATFAGRAPSRNFTLNELSLRFAPWACRAKGLKPAVRAALKQEAALVVAYYRETEPAKECTTQLFVNPGAVLVDDHLVFTAKSIGHVQKLAATQRRFVATLLRTRSMAKACAGVAGDVTPGRLRCWVAGWIKDGFLFADF
jgi:hypothetical protein